MIGLSIAVFTFLFVFQPFGLAALGDNLLAICIGYALVMILTGIVFELVCSRFQFSDWTVGKEIIQIGLFLVLLTTSNFAYSCYLGFTPSSFSAWLVFSFYTLAVGLVPIAIGVIINQQRILSAHSKEAENLMEQITASKRNEEQVIASPPGETVTIELADENGKLALALELSALVAFKAADNYVECFYLADKKQEKMLIRNTIKKIEAQLSADFKRVHRSWLVNSKHISSVEGNSQGYRLQLEGMQEEVPVSRSRRSVLQELV